MLTNALAKTLIDRNIINKSTKIEAYYTRMDFSGSYNRTRNTLSLANVCKHGEEYSFVLYDQHSDLVVTVPVEDVMAIDGMEPSLVAEAFDLQMDGTKKILGKKRGRPRKHPLNESA